MFGAIAASNRRWRLKEVIPFLDTYSSPKLALSLKKLSSSYTGSAIRIRRDSDNTEMDIGFLANGIIDISSLLDFVGSGNGQVVTWYDQSGNNNNAYQYIPERQPYIVQDGELCKVKGFPAIRFDIINGFPVFFDVVPFRFTLASAFSVEYKEEGDVNSRFLSFTPDSSTADFANNIGSASFKVQGLTRNSEGISINVGEIKNKLLLGSAHIQSNQAILKQKSSLYYDTNVVTPIRECEANVVQIGTEGQGINSPRFKTGYVLETVFYDFDNYLNAQAIEDAMNKYYLL